MEKKKKQLEEWGFKSIHTSMGEMFADNLYWEDLVETTNEIGAEIYLLKKRDGERVYSVLGQQYDKYDRKEDFNDKCVEIFDYNGYEEWEREELFYDIFVRCIRPRLEDAMDRDDANDMLNTLRDFDRIKKFVERELNHDREILVIDEYLSADVIERYPTWWHEDVWEYRMALRLKED